LKSFVHEITPTINNKTQRMQAKHTNGIIYRNSVIRFDKETNKNENKHCRNT